MGSSTAIESSVKIQIVSVTSRVDKSNNPYKEIVDAYNKKWYVWAKNLAEGQIDLFIPGNYLQIDISQSNQKAIPKIKRAVFISKSNVPSGQTNNAVQSNSSVCSNSGSSVDKCKYRTEALSLAVHLVSQGVLDRNNVLLEADVYYAYITGDITHEPAKIANYLSGIKG
ncbi:MAG: hypothetical protein LLF82_000289 [Dehalococcoides mccartyi]|uniref:hypothetical protein n=1 Tax=Dehalococcoides mccartyi TaxID=61435 RepID=UPI002432E92D|nr:hypothetical protein [Dehalococcoides mccartyi]MCF7634823.1 hypothetical protein [Dehalococcoides mccartyi]